MWCGSILLTQASVPIFMIITVLQHENYFWITFKPLVDWIESNTLYVGRVQFQYYVCWAMRFRHSQRKMAKVFANRRPPSDATFCRVWSGSALFANYPFRGLQTTMGFESAFSLFWKEYINNKVDWRRQIYKNSNKTWEFNKLFHCFYCYIGHKQQRVVWYIQDQKWIPRSICTSPVSDRGFCCFHTFSG